MLPPHHHTRPPPTHTQTFDEVARSPAYCLSLLQAPGDVLLLHNTAMVLLPSVFVDGREPGEQRRMARMWLNCGEAAHALGR